MSITRNLFVKLFVVCLLFVGVAVPASAQNTSKVELSGGYNLLRFNDETIPGGWYADVAGKITPMFAVVGQVTGNYKSMDVSGISVDTTIHTFMAGVRVSAHAVSGVTPFAHVLVGAARTSGSTDLSGALPVNLSDSTTDAALQLGGGIKYVPGKVGLQVGVDYVRLFTEDEGTNALRFAAGVVFGF
jgi:hypothetical protein